MHFTADVARIYQSSPTCRWLLSSGTAAHMDYHRCSTVQFWGACCCGCRRAGDRLAHRTPKRIRTAAIMAGRGIVMTLLRIAATTDVPPYELLRRQLTTQIQTGQLPTGTKLAAVRRLAADLGIAPGAVARAYKELGIEGHLVTRGRNG